jgi:CheY-like chemotaxis protein
MTERLPRLMVVDDDPFLLDCFEALLGGRFELVCVEEPEEALLRLSSGETFDAVLCDVQMPHLRGPEIQDLLMKIGCPMATRFIWMSSSGCGVEGAALYKPFGPKELELAVLPWARHDRLPEVTGLVA